MRKVEVTIQVAKLNSVDHDDEDGHDDHAHGDNPTIPCEGAPDHEDMHDQQVAKLADGACLGKTTCPEGSPCAEAIEVLVEYYERCNVGHSDEDPEFVAVEIEVPESPCMEHAHDHDDHAGMSHPLPPPPARALYPNLNLNPKPLTQTALACDDFSVFPG